MTDKLTPQQRQELLRHTAPEYEQARTTVNPVKALGKDPATYSRLYAQEMPKAYPGGSEYASDYKFALNPRGGIIGKREAIVTPGRDASLQRAEEELEMLKYGLPSGYYGSEQHQREETISQRLGEPLTNEVKIARRISELSAMIHAGVKSPSY